MSSNMQSQLPLQQLQQLGKGGGAGTASLAPQPDPLSSADRAFLGYGGAGQPVDWFTAMGMPGGMNPPSQGPGWAGQSSAPQPTYGLPQSSAPPSVQTPVDLTSGFQGIGSLLGKGGGGGGFT